MREASTLADFADALLGDGGVLMGADHVLNRAAANERGVVELRSPCRARRARRVAGVFCLDPERMELVVATLRPELLVARRRRPSSPPAMASRLTYARVHRAPRSDLVEPDEQTLVAIRFERLDEIPAAPTRSLRARR